MTYDDMQAETRTITALFDNRSDANKAIDDLVKAGIPRDSIRLVAGQKRSQTSSEKIDEEGGFWDTLKELFLPEEDRYSYAEGLRRGGFLITVVAATEDGYERALDILDREGTVDIGKREATWRAEGWGGYTEADSASRSADLGETEVIPVAEEELRVGKRDVSHGRVRVRSYVVETPVTEQVSLREENVQVERRRVDRPLSADDRMFQDRTVEFEERAEEAVVAKDARVKEEVVIRKEAQERAETISDTVRHTEVEVEDERDFRGSTRRRSAR
jgi:uncharacterized protein (TIGR02271 family)